MLICGGGLRADENWMSAETSWVHDVARWSSQKIALEECEVTVGWVALRTFGLQNLLQLLPKTFLQTNWKENVMAVETVCVVSIARCGLIVESSERKECRWKMSSWR